MRGTSREQRHFQYRIVLSYLILGLFFFFSFHQFHSPYIFLNIYPFLLACLYCFVFPQKTDWNKADSFLEVDRSVGEVTWAKPGTVAGLNMLQSFCEKRLKHFSTSRNDPNKQALSNLSPWMHFGKLCQCSGIIMSLAYPKT